MPETNLLWLDLETTGSDERYDEIIEVGCILTDLNLDLVPNPASRDWVVNPSQEAINRMLGTPVVREMHAANGLLWDVLDRKGLSVSAVENNLLAWLFSNTDKKKSVVLAGSGVGHFDSRFIKAHMPRLADWLSYRVLDIGNLRRAFKYWNIPLPPHNKNERKNHRALDDIRLHLDEARSFKLLFQDHLQFEAGGGEVNRPDVR